MELLNSLIKACITQLTLQVVNVSLYCFVSLIPFCPPLSSLNCGETQILLYLICTILMFLAELEHPLIIADLELLSISQGCKCKYIMSQPSHYPYKIIS